MADRRETIEYNGDRYHRYPDSDHKQLRRYYWAHTEYETSPKSLHRQKWTDANGEIPDGHVIHHKDEDTLNNNLSNLEAMPKGEHNRIHMDADFLEQAAENVVEHAMPEARDWHQSEEGHEWHKQQYEEVKEQLHKKRYTHECDWCGDEFDSSFKERQRFCSEECQQKESNERHRGDYDETRECDWCGDEFECSKYKDTRFCSQSCGAKHRHRT